MNSGHGVENHIIESSNEISQEGGGEEGVGEERYAGGGGMGQK